MTYYNRIAFRYASTADRFDQQAPTSVTLVHTEAPHQRVVVVAGNKP
jgi:hypothetical protein